MSEAGRREFVEFFSGSDGVETRSRVIPVGVDVDKFVPLELREEKQARIDHLLEGLKSAGGGGSGTREMEVDPEAAEELSAVDWARDPIVVYNGKFLWTKGVQVLLAAAPLILGRTPAPASSWWASAPSATGWRRSSTPWTRATSSASACCWCTPGSSTLI